MGKRVKAPPYTKLRGGWYYENFIVAGRPFRSTLRTKDREQAARIAAKRREDALKASEGLIDPEEARESYSVSEMLGTYTKAKARLPSFPTMAIRSERIIAFFKPATPIHEIDASAIDAFKEWLRRSFGPIKTCTVNGYLRHLRAALWWMRDLHKGRVQTIKWGGDRGVMEEEGEPSDRVLTWDEERRLRGNMDDDLRRLFDFAILTALRKQNLLNLTWSQIKYEHWQEVGWDAAQFTVMQKSRKPGGARHTVVIGEGERAILDACRGHHPEFVFAFLAERNRHRLGMRKGERYRWKQAWHRLAWEAACKAAGVSGISWHRATRGTSANRAAAAAPNLRIAMRHTGHQSLETLLRYCSAETEDVRLLKAKMADMAQNRHKPARPALKVVR